MQDKRENKYETVLSELYCMCTDAENKPSDRISAAKLLLEYLKEGQAQGGEIRIVFDGADSEITE